MKKKYQSLYQAVQNKQVDQVKNLLEDRKLEPHKVLFDLNGDFIEPQNHDKTHDLHSLLYAAVQVEDKEIVLSFLNAGISPEHGTLSPINAAAEHGKLEILKLLLPQVTKLETSNKHKPLHIAARDGHIEIVQYLLENQIVPIDTIEEESTALYCASKEGRLEIVIELLKGGANPIIAHTADFKLPIHSAAWNGNLEIVKALYDKNTRTIFQSLMRYENLQLQAKTKYNETPLHFACHSGNLEIVKFFVQEGAKLNEEEKLSYSTPLALAVTGGHFETVKYLLQQEDLNPLLSFHNYKVTKDNACSTAKLYLRNAERHFTSETSPIRNAEGEFKTQEDVKEAKETVDRISNKIFNLVTEAQEKWKSAHPKEWAVYQKEAEAKKQETEAKKQEADAEQEAEAKKQEADAEQEAEAKKQEAEAKKQEAEAKKQEAEAKKQETEAKKQETEAKKQETEAKKKADAKEKQETKEKAIKETLDTEAKQFAIKLQEKLAASIQQTAIAQAAIKEESEKKLKKLKTPKHHKTGINFNLQTRSKELFLPKEKLQQLKSNPEDFQIQEYRYNAETRVAAKALNATINTLNLLLLPEEIMPSNIKQNLNKNERTKIALSLIENCKDIKLLNQFAPYKFSNPLFLAAEDGNLEVIKALQNKGICLDIDHLQDSEAACMQDNHYKFGGILDPVIVAVRNGHLEVVKALLINAKGKEIREFIDVIFNESNTKEIIKIIEEVKDKKTAFLYAAKGGHINLVKEFLQDKKNITKKDEKTAFLYAAKGGHINLVKEFLQDKKNITKKDKKTAFEAAHQNNQIEVVKYFLDNKIISNEAIKAAFNHHTSTTQERYIGILNLLKTNAAVTKEMKQLVVINISQKHLKTHADIIHVLDPNLELIDLKNEVQNDFKQKTQQSEDISDKLTSAIERSDYTLTNTLLFEGGRGHINYNNAFALAIQQGKLKLVKFLVEERKIDINRVIDNNTPLHYAAQAGHGNVVKYLIARGADVKAKNGYYNDKKTPLQCAKEGSEAYKILNEIEQGEKRRTREFGTATLTGEFAAVSVLPPVGSALLFGTATVLASTTLTVFACAATLLGIIAVSALAIYAIDKAAEQSMYREFAKAADAIDLEHAPLTP